MSYKIIRNDEQYDLYLDRLSEIFDIDFSKNPEYEDEFDLLSLLIEDYEKRNHPIDNPSPISYIKFIMEQKGLTNKDMEQYLGSPSKVSEVLNGKRSLSLNMIKKLHNGLDIPTDILIQDINSIDEENMRRIEWFSDSLIKNCGINDIDISTIDNIHRSYSHLAQSKLDSLSINKYKEITLQDNLIPIQ